MNTITDILTRQHRVVLKEINELSDERMRKIARGEDISANKKAHLTAAKKLRKLIF